jgi:hypothetical protein
METRVPVPVRVLKRKQEPLRDTRDLPNEWTPRGPIPRRWVVK